MLEGWADNMDQNRFIEALQFGTYEANKVIQIIKQSKYANTQKRSHENLDKQSPELDKLKEAISNLGHAKIYEILTTYSHDKKSRDEAINDTKFEVGNLVFDEKEFFKSKHLTVFNEFYANLVKDVLRNLIIDESKRVDGRSLDEIRQITSEIGVFENLHGSALFQRGQTQVLCSLTFDSPYAMYTKDGVQSMMSPSLTKIDKKFMLHYDFPAYATNEIGKQGGRADRREVGHGALAEKGVYPIVPADFPFTIRLLCEVLESNGSSSMASVCAGSLALLEAGVEISEPVCGVAMGLVTRKNQHGNIESYKILSDITGMEDYAGDMDFKIAGTAKGITAVQADIKLSGLPLNIAIEAIEKSKDARVFILDKMASTILEANKSKKHTLPQMKELEIPVHKRNQFIGAGGSNLKKIQATGVSITAIDETKFNLFAPNIHTLTQAEDLINNILDQKREPNFEFGGIYSAKVVEIVPSGVMVQLYSTMKPTLLPNSQIDARPVRF
jgi:polyribonucleotide nucleotidyltransferase